MENWRVLSNNILNKIGTISGDNRKRKEIAKQGRKRKAKQISRS